MWSSSIATLRTVRGSWSCSVDFFSTPSTTHDLPRTPTWLLASAPVISFHRCCRCLPSTLQPADPAHDTDRCPMQVAGLAEQAIGARLENEELSTASNKHAAEMLLHLPSEKSIGNAVILTAAVPRLTASRAYSTWNSCIVSPAVRVRNKQHHGNVHVHQARRR